MTSTSYLKKSKEELLQEIDDCTTAAEEYFEARDKLFFKLCEDVSNLTKTICEWHASIKNNAPGYSTEYQTPAPPPKTPEEYAQAYREIDSIYRGKKYKE